MMGTVPKRPFHLDEYIQEIQKRAPTHPEERTLLLIDWNDFMKYAMPLRK